MFDYEECVEKFGQLAGCDCVIELCLLLLQWTEWFITGIYGHVSILCSSSNLIIQRASLFLFYVVVMVHHRDDTVVFGAALFLRCCCCLRLSQWDDASGDWAVHHPWRLCWSDSVSASQPVSAQHIPVCHGQTGHGSVTVLLALFSVENLANLGKLEDYR